METAVTRSRLLRTGGLGAAALLLGGTALGPGARAAAAAPPQGGFGPLAAGDLAYTRLLIAIELLTIDFYTNALAARHWRGATARDARLALVNENEHYTYLANAISIVGLTPLSAGDVSFTYEAGTFYSAASLFGMVFTLESLALGACLGSAGKIANPVLAGAIAQITACEAQHLSAFSVRGREPAFTNAFPQPLSIAEASDALDAYTS